jgi:hypothetical protein
MTDQKLSFEERRAKAARRLEVAKARYSRIEARVKEDERKRDTRRKILLGAFFDHVMRTNATHASVLRECCKADLASFLRPEDTVLFDDLLG